MNIKGSHGIKVYTVLTTYNQTCSHPRCMDEAESAMKIVVPQACKLSTSFSQNNLLLKAISALNETEDKTREQWYGIHYDLLRKTRNLVRQKGASLKAWQEERTSLRKQRARIVRQLSHPGAVKESTGIDVTRVASGRSGLLFIAIKTLKDIEDQTRKQWHRTRDELSQQLEYLRRRRQAGRDDWQVARKHLRRQYAKLSKQLSDLEKEQKQEALRNSLSAIQDRFPWNRLPLEIRHMILHILLVHDKHIIARGDFWFSKTTMDQSSITKICPVSKSMRDEAYQIFYSTNTFSFSSPDYLTSVLTATQIHLTLSHVVLHINSDATKNCKCFTRLQQCRNLKSLRIVLDQHLHTRKTRAFHGILPFREPLPKLQDLDVTLSPYLLFRFDYAEEYVHLVRSQLKELLMLTRKDGLLSKGSYKIH